MASRAAAFGGFFGVKCLGGPEALIDFRMARETDAALFGSHKALHFRRMRRMASRALAASHGRMNLLLFQHLGHLRMAGEA